MTRSSSDRVNQTNLPPFKSNEVRSFQNRLVSCFATGSFKQPANSSAENVLSKDFLPARLRGQGILFAESNQVGVKVEKGFLLPLAYAERTSRGKEGWAAVIGYFFATSLAPTR